MTERIIFSIVVPTYNRAHLISHTIESILAQTFRDFELIIIDDGSTDNTEQVIQKYLSEQVHYYKKQNAERAAARNFGTQKAQGEYINWFDSDDIMLPNHLEDAAKMISKYSRPEVFAQGHRYQYPSGRIINTVSYTSTLNDLMYNGNPMANSPVIVRRDIALANLFNADRELSGSEDFELWLRLAAKYPVYSSPAITVAIIYHDERSTLTMTDPDKLIKRFTKFIQYTTSNAEVLALLGKQRSFFEMKNYLLLAVDLSVSGHLMLGRKYLAESFRRSPKIIFERGFYAFIKHSLKSEKH
jgi:glycosyltransferase involved in cell wall biosynthesis